MHDIKIVRLRTGEDIISMYQEDNDTEMVMLKDPMTVMFKRLPTGSSMMIISPWLPIELIKDNTATIYTDDILTIVEPKAILIEHYVKMVDGLHKYMEEDENNLRRHLQELEEDFEDDEIEEEDIEEMMEALKDRKNYKLH